ncbi:MAG TPA: 50S ribosomal protein L21 [Candidatus Dormibacteraeota bacterium]|jgi:large subunit ribosomal protein L21|nr:50S ribosomal protein L21 [Candidatus Dormibacteraeota bacterium]
MEAVVRIGGKQYRVSEGQRLEVERLVTPVGESVSFGEVLVLTDGPASTIGRPTVDGASVSAKVVAQTRGPKILVYKYKPKKRYRRLRGARADLSVLEVTGVSAGQKA